MEIISKSPERLTEVVVTDKRGQGNAFHKYEVRPVTGEVNSSDNVEFAKISFQNGPIKEFGINGCHQEDLLAIVQHRLECFQEGDFACIENERALNSLKECIAHLNSRTKDRNERGVEGTNVR